jgi:hypothetical protein
MKMKQVQEYCQEAVRISERDGTHASLTFLIGKKFRVNFRLLRKTRRKLQMLYPIDNNKPEEHPLNQGGRALKMSYALTVQEHYSVPIEQVKHLESLLANFAEAIRKTFSQEEIRNYLESSSGIDTDPKKITDMEGLAKFSANDLLLEAEEIVEIEHIKKLLLQNESGQ